MVSRVLIGVSCQLSNFLHNVMGTHWQGPDICLFVSIFSVVLNGVSCQSSICLHEVTGNHCECLVNRLLVSMKSRVLIVSVLSIVC